MSLPISLICLLLLLIMAVAPVKTGNIVAYDEQCNPLTEIDTQAINVVNSDIRFKAILGGTSASVISHASWTKEMDEVYVSELFQQVKFCDPNKLLFCESVLVQDATGSTPEGTKTKVCRCNNAISTQVWDKKSKSYPCEAKYGHPCDFAFPAGTTTLPFKANFKCGNHSVCKPLGYSKGKTVGERIKEATGAAFTLPHFRTAWVRTMEKFVVAVCICEEGYFHDVKGQCTTGKKPSSTVSLHGRISDFLTALLIAAHLLSTI